MEDYFLTFCLIDVDDHSSEDFLWTSKKVDQIVSEFANKTTNIPEDVEEMFEYNEASWVDIVAAYLEIISNRNFQSISNQQSVFKPMEDFQVLQGSILIVQRVILPWDKSLSLVFSKVLKNDTTLYTSITFLIFFLYITRLVIKIM